MAIRRTITDESNLNADGSVNVSLTTSTNYIGSLKILSEVDDGTNTTTPLLVGPETSQDYRLRVGADTILFDDSFAASAQNTSKWSYTFTTLTAFSTGYGTVNFGNVQGTTGNTGAFMRTFQYFPFIGTSPLSIDITAGVFNAPLATGEIWLMGFGLPVSATASPTDGVWFKLTSAGWNGVIAYNGVIFETDIFWANNRLVISDLQKWSLIIGEESVEFWRNDVLLTRTTIPQDHGSPCLSGSLPVFMMKYVLGSTTAATVTNSNTMRVANIKVSTLDIATFRPMPHQQATQGMMGYVGQNGQTQAQTANWTNNTAPVAAALVNASAAAVFTGLGGITAVLPTLAANNDGILFNFLNPVPVIATTITVGRNLIVYGVRVQGAVTVVFAGGPVLYAYALATGNTGTGGTLAQTDSGSFVSGTLHAPRRVFVGMESYPVTAPVGTLGSGAYLRLDSPIVVRPGEYLQLLARNMGTVTTTGAITVGVQWDAHWE